LGARPLDGFSIHALKLEHHHEAMYPKPNFQKTIIANLSPQLSLIDQLTQPITHYVELSTKPETSRTPSL
jgi:hypothetical protein